jgi:hypothetical protein
MFIYFSVTEVDELFTTYDYKQLLTAVENHLTDSVKHSGKAFYNPGKNEGVLHIGSTDEYIYLQDLQYAYGNEFVTVKFTSA